MARLRAAQPHVTSWLWVPALQVLDAEEGGYTPQCLPDFHVLKDWGRLGLTAGGRERVCCFPGADPCQDKLLVGDNRCTEEGGQGDRVGEEGLPGALSRPCRLASSAAPAQSCSAAASALPRSLLWMLIEGEPWSPADHHHWPPAFRAAARTLLLAHRRGAPVQGAAGPSAALVELQACGGGGWLAAGGGGRRWWRAAPRAAHRP